MAKTAPNIKRRISPNETVFYLFKLSREEYLLYDSYMGDPVEYGKINSVSARLKSHLTDLNKNIKKDAPQKEIYLYKMEADVLKGWKEVKKMQGFDYSSPDKIKGSFHQTIPLRPTKNMGNEEIYFWFDMKNIHYLYDIDLGSPVCYGDSNKVKAKILEHSKKHNFSVILFHMPNKSDAPTYKMSIKYNMDNAAEKKTLREKKKTETSNPQQPEKDKIIEEQK